MANLFSIPPTAELPLTLGKDLYLTFRNKVPASDPATYVDYPGNVSVKLVIGRGSSEVTSNATITGSTATCKIESQVADTIKAGALWRVVVSVSNGVGVPSTDDVPLNGKVVRADGT